MELLTRIPAIHATESCTPLVLATTGVSSDRPAVTSMRPLSVIPVLMASRVIRLSVVVYTKLPSRSLPSCVFAAL
jgi:hypothetical protein